MFSYTVIRINALNEKSVIYQTNSYSEAEKVLNYFNENKTKYGYAKDIYNILQYTNTQKIINKILNKGIMDFNKYDDIINNNKYEMLFIYIYYSLKNHDDFDSLTDNQKETLIEFIHYTYLKDNGYMDLGIICTTALIYKDEILSNKLDYYTLLEYCYNA